MPLGSLAQHSTHRMVLVCEGRAWSGAGLRGAVASVSMQLSQGDAASSRSAAPALCPGDRVALLGASSDAYIIGLLGLLDAGCIAVPLNTRWSAPELAHALATTTPRLMLVDEGHKELAAHALLCAPHGTAAIVFTSGTTGPPKGVSLSHASLHAQSLAKLACVGYARDDVYLHLAPLFHVGGLSSLLANLAAGAAHVVLPRFDAPAALSAIAAHRVTSFIAVPTMVADLAEAAGMGVGAGVAVGEQATGDGGRGGDDEPSCSGRAGDAADATTARRRHAVFPSVARVLVGAGGTSAVLRARLKALFPRAELHSAYGMTEAASSITFMRLEEWPPHSSAGPGIEVAIVPRGDFDCATSSPGTTAGGTDSVASGGGGGVGGYGAAAGVGVGVGGSGNGAAAAGVAVGELSSMESASRANLLQINSTMSGSPKWKGIEKRLPQGGGASLPQGDMSASASAMRDLLRDRDVLKGLVRRGIPPALRPTLWLWLSGGYDLAAAAEPGLYAKLCRSVELVEPRSRLAIKEGVEGLWYAFRFNTLYQSSRGRDALARVTRAAIQYRPEALNYSRGLHQMAAFVLVVFGVASEEAAFWTLLGLLTVRLFPGSGGEVRAGAFVEHGVLDALLRKKEPRLVTHLQGMGWTLSDITKGWIDRLFTSNLPPETAVRVWDCVMSEGSKVVHRVALALIKRHETVLLGCTDQVVLTKVLDLRMKRTAEDVSLMEAAFSSVGSMPSAQLSTYRAAVLRSPAYAAFVADAEANVRTPVERGHIAVGINPEAGHNARFLSGHASTSTAAANAAAANSVSLSSIRHHGSSNSLASRVSVSSVLSGGLASAGGVSSAVCSDDDHGSDGDGVGTTHKQRTTSGRPGSSERSHGSQARV
ncbi:hypothetical protein FOA52_003266 [Chlamydomonas sp. UWO 241]|nr:hypothetical protein FOA52_003266 [Chlamydomonas sp. UWO 241]